MTNKYYFFLKPPLKLTDVDKQVYLFLTYPLKFGYVCRKLVITCHM